MDNKSLVVSEKGFFYKIKMFIKNIFNRKETYEQELHNNYNNSINQQERKTSFTNEIKIETDKERERLLKLQSDYEKGLIREKDMTLEEVSGIEKLYIEQISKLREDYTRYKNIATNLRRKLVR